MSFSYTRTESFTRTSARRVAAKVAGDLSYMQALYDRPMDVDIEAYEEEVVELLAGGYLADVSYGFRRDSNWVVALKYAADTSGNLVGDDAVGKLDPSTNTDGATFYSFLIHSTKWDNLTADERRRIEETMTIKRTYGTEPGSAGGYWTQDKTYSADGGGVRRSAFHGLGS